MHQFELNGYRIVVDEHSASIHSVDPIAYFMIGAYDHYRKQYLKADFEALDQLREAARAESAGSASCEALKSRSQDAAIARLIAPKERMDRAREILPQDLLDQILRDARDEFPDEDPAELESCLEDILDLQRAGQLFTPDPFRRIALNLERRPLVIKALCLHVAHTCNLNCSYCFAAQGKYHGERALMSEAVGYRAIDFLLENSGKRKNLEVDFFGGEPLMNWEVCKKIVMYARSKEAEWNKRFRFTLTTNGMAINDDVIDFANREMSNVVLSLDGRESVHDHLRKDYMGRGSWATIVPKFQEFVRRRKGNYYIRGTYTHFNTDFMKDIEVMLDLGFRELSLEPVVCAPDDPYALTEEDLPILYEQYEALARRMIEKDEEGDPFNFYHYILDLGHGPCIYKRIAGCGSGTEYFAVTPWGELYPCHQFVGDPQYSMGDIWKGVSNHDKQCEFCRCNVYAHRECDDCWARLYCSGGCSANNYHASGKLDGVYDFGCQLFKKRMECALMVATHRMMKKMEEA